MMTFTDLTETLVAVAGAAMALPPVFQALWGAAVAWFVAQAIWFRLARVEAPAPATRRSNSGSRRAAGSTTRRRAPRKAEQAAPATSNTAVPVTELGMAVDGPAPADSVYPVS